MRSASVAPAMTPDELTSRDKLARALFDIDNLTALVAAHAGMGLLINELRDSTMRPPTALELEDLLLPDNTKNVHVRYGVTRTGIQTAMPPLVMVSYRAVVAWHRLPDDVRTALKNGSIGLGDALRPYGVRRHITAVRFTDDVDLDGGKQLMRVNATLSLHGVGPVALVDETLYTSALR